MSVHRLLYVTFTILLIALSEPYEVTAQQLRYNFKNYTPSEGLPSSEVYQVLQDSYHYMWFATDHGICRYNGYEFKTFNLADNSILGIYEDYKKRIWAYSFSGRLFYYENGEFRDYEWNDLLEKAIKPAVINAIYIDKTETVHVSASGPTYLKVSQDGKIQRLNELTPSAKLISVQVNSRDFFTAVINYPTSFAKMLFNRTSKTEVNIKLNKRNFQFTIPVLVQPERCRAKLMSNGDLFFYTRNCYAKINGQSIVEFMPTDYFIDDVEFVDSVYFFATNAGLIVKDRNGRILSRYFNDLRITSIEKDYEGGLWFSTLTNGVFYLNRSRISNLAKGDDIINEQIKYILRLKDSTVLFGNYKNKIYRFSENRFIDDYYFNVSYIASLYQYSNSEIIAGVANGFDPGFWSHLNSQKAFGYTFLFLPNGSNFIRDDTTLYSGVTDGIIKFNCNHLNKEPEVSKEFFRASKIYLTKKKEMVVGNQFGLWYFKSGRIYPYDSTKPILKTRITDINEYKGELLLAGTRGSGVIIIRGKDLFEINESNGLISNNIRKIFIEGNHIWLATNRGICVISITSESPLKYTIRNISVQDGLLSNEINDIADYGNEVIIASNAGVSFLDKSKVLTKETHQLPFYIVSIYANTKVIQAEELSNLSYNQRNVSISFDALSYSNPGKNNYRYRLNGYDTSWIYTNDRTIQFNPLPYGNFKLEIQAKREFDSWDEFADKFSLSINCRPPFWSTIWFYAIMAVLFGLASFFFFKRRVSDLKKRQNEKENLQRKITETEQMALKSQMNPHFIFNCLNSIQQYVIESDVAGANRFISGFSKLIRQTLDFSAKDRISLEEEISYLSNYLNLEKARTEGQFNFEVHVQCKQQLSDLYIPPLLLQPYVENAIRHGVRHLKNKEGVIKLSFDEEEDFLQCKIEDNGIGRKMAMQLKSKNPIEYQSKGMSLTAERVELLNKAREHPIQIKTEDIENNQQEISGTRVILIFPL